MLGMCMTSLSCLAYIYQIHVLRRWDKKHNYYQYVIGLSDFHDKSHAINKQHRYYLERRLLDYQRSTKVIVEDLSSTNNNGRRTCGRYTINSRGGVLGGLASVLKRSGVDVENIEYRYCRVVSLGPLINNIHARVDSFPSSNTLYIDALYREVMREIDSIRSYADGRVLNSRYKRTISGVMRALRRLRLDRYQKMSIAEYCIKCTKSSNRLDVLQRLCTFDSDLLDVKLVHSVIVAQNRRHVFAIAGGTHIKHACTLLKHAGYKMVFVSKLASQCEYDLSKCLGSHIVENVFCVKPEPVDISIITKFFHK